MTPIVIVKNLSKTYSSKLIALDDISLEISEGEILALLGPNGAGKTTLISTICGIVNPSSGKIFVDGFDAIKDYRDARRLIGLVPQELVLDSFETVLNTLRFSRGLFGKPRNDNYLKEVLKKLSLWDKRDSPIMTLSGGMKRRVLIAKALSHEPRVLFLDEPTAGVDVELRKDMWALVNSLRASGVTVILTTHYIEEAEAIADRVGVMNQGKMLLLSDKKTLLKKMGKKELKIELHDPITAIPESLSAYKLILSEQRTALLYSYDTSANRTGITKLLTDISKAGLILKDVSTRQSSLEDIFTTLLEEKK
ncbi:MAG: ABC transporter ATP-binding protein [Rhodobacterales bacterium]